MIPTPDLDTTCTLLREIDVAIDEAWSTQQSFGSWFIRGTAKGKLIRVVWDGRDYALIIQVPSSSGAPNDWSDRWIAGKSYSQNFSDLRDGVLAVMNDHHQS